jgi:hypothetical protein
MRLYGIEIFLAYKGKPDSAKFTFNFQLYGKY